MLNYKAQDNTAQFSAVTDERQASWNNLGESEITVIVSRLGTAEIRALSRAYDKNIFDNVMLIEITDNDEIITHLLGAIRFWI